MAKRDLIQRRELATAVRDAVNDDAMLDPTPTVVPQRNSPANDNPSIHDLPTCLAVSDAEVMLLHRYLSREILALFG